MGTAYALGTLRPQDTLAQDTSALNYSAELSGHFGIDLYETLRHHNTLTGHIYEQDTDIYRVFDLLQ